MAAAAEVGTREPSLSPCPCSAALLTNVSVSEPLSLVTFWSLCLLVVQRAHPCGTPAHADVSCPVSQQTPHVSTSRWARPPWAGLRAGVPGEISELVEGTRASSCARGWGSPGMPMPPMQMCTAVAEAGAGPAPRPLGPERGCKGCRRRGPSPEPALRCWARPGRDRSCCIFVNFGFHFPRAPC